MKKLKLTRSKFGFKLVLDGDIKIDESKIKPYEQYYKEQTDRLLKEEVYNYLTSLVPFVKPPKDGEMYFSYQSREGGMKALSELADYLIKDIKTEAE
jgi:hypothetical protein